MVGFTGKAFGPDAKKWQQWWEQEGQSPPTSPRP